MPTKRKALCCSSVGRGEDFEWFGAGQAGHHTNFRDCSQVPEQGAEAVHGRPSSVRQCLQPRPEAAVPRRIDDLPVMGSVFSLQPEKGRPYAGHAPVCP